MPTTTILGGLRFDARPDRVDFRDLPYRPPLVSLPDTYPGPELIEQYFPLYAADGMVLDQGNEGACTGFGLAAVVNYLRWASSLPARRVKGKIEPAGAPPLVSTRMLYQNARLYDEWQGEDYEGSSCRGAMKGFHKHGVCSEAFWPYRHEDGTDGLSRDGWDQDAARCPLGAYYRVDAKSLVDMQAAINEVHAIYVSGNVHNGWGLDTCSSIDEAIIRPKRARDKLGGHAFCLVGYRPDGFIVQNSWGPGWGFQGFAVLPYDEWTQHGSDAWVLALGAPMLSVRSPASRTALSLEERSALRVPIEARAAEAGQKFAVAPWIDGEEAFHSVFVGHDGRPDRELVEANDGADSVRRVIEGGIKQAMSDGLRHVAIYAHGGLNSRDAGLTRARILGPWLKANGIHPIFVIWQTGFLESAGDILQIAVDRVAPAAPERVEGWLVDQFQKGKDRAFEATARGVGVKAIWENMKSRGQDASRGEGALRMVAGHLRSAFAEVTADGAAVPNIHLLGHSAGAIMLGSFLEALASNALKASSLHLWAPACTVSFATETYGAAFANGTVSPKKTYVGVLSDENEQSDACVPGAYSKSLLYLVSRALEVDHKTPVLGMQKIWKGHRPSRNDDIFNQSRWGDMTAWDKVAGDVKIDEVTAPAVPTLREDRKVETIEATHGSFDNNLDEVNLALRRMLGRAPAHAVANLKGF